MNIYGLFFFLDKCSLANTSNPTDEETFNPTDEETFNPTDEETSNFLMFMARMTTPFFTHYSDVIK